MKRAANKPLLGIAMGDPAGIGPEVNVKALARPAVRRLCRPVVIGSPEVLAKAAKAFKVPAMVRRIDDPGAALPAGVIGVLDPLPEPLASFTPGRVSKETGAAQARYIQE